MTGNDIAAGFRNRYRSRKEAFRLAQPSMRDFLERELATLPTANLALARRGDIVMLDNEGDISLGLIALNGRSILKPGDKGVVALSFDSAVRAWHV